MRWSTPSGANSLRPVSVTEWEEAVSREDEEEGAHGCFSGGRELKVKMKVVRKERG